MSLGSVIDLYLSLERSSRVGSTGHAEAYGSSFDGQ